MIDGIRFRDDDRRAARMLRQAALLDSEAATCASALVGAAKRASARELRQRAAELQKCRRTGVRTA